MQECEKLSADCVGPKSPGERACKPTQERGKLGHRLCRVEIAPVSEPAQTNRECLLRALCSGYEPCTPYNAIIIMRGTFSTACAAGHGTLANIETPKAPGVGQYSLVGCITCGTAVADKMTLPPTPKTILKINTSEGNVNAGVDVNTSDVNIKHVEKVSIQCL